MLEETKPTFLINGELHHIEPDVYEKTLVQYLRESGLTGTKLSCGQGHCGACTVLVTRRVGGEYERVPLTACSTLLWTLHGTEVTTVEGLGSTKSCLHPIQERLYSCHGSQCGFCSPGMVMSMAGVLCKKNPPDIEDIVSGLAGNLCRCTGYRPILEAFSTFASSPLEKEPQAVDSETEEIATYDPAMFKGLVPSDLEVQKETKVILESIQPIEKLEFKVDGRRLFEPTTVSGALDIYSKYPQAVYRMGGTGDYKKYEEGPAPKVVISLSSVTELKGIAESNKGVHIKAGVTYSEFCNGFVTLEGQKYESLRVLKSAVEQIASVQLRNVATLVGGILWGHPSSDVLPILTVTKAYLHVQSPEGQRNVNVAPNVGSLIMPGEIVTEVVIPYNLEKDEVFFKKIARRKSAELAVVNLAMLLNSEKTDCRIVIGGIDLAVKDCIPVQPIRAIHLEHYILSNHGSLNEGVGNLKTEMKKDIGNNDEYKISVISEIIQNIRKTDQNTKKKLKAHQLFEKTVSSQASTDPITRPIPHIYAAEQCTGEATYVDDIPKVYDELVLLPVHSTEAHAKIIDIDVSAAMNVPDVVSWVSAADIPGKNAWSVGHHYDEEVLPKNEVLYHGHMIGVIAAKTMSAAKTGVSLVKIKYERLPVIKTIQEAVEANSILPGETKLERFQDVALQGSGQHRIEGNVSLGGQEHFYLETHSALAIPSKEKEELTIYYNNQEPCNLQYQLSSILKIPQNRIVLKVRRIGGSFGGKSRMVVALIAAIAAKKTNKPCRFILERGSDVSTTGHRHEVSASYNIEFTNEGKITNSTITCDINAGCTTDMTPIWSMYLALRIDGGYTLKNIHIDAIPRKTHLASNTAFRGFGGPEGGMIIEDSIERIALELNQDPALVRSQNLTRKGDKLHYGDQIIEDDNLLKCWNECLQQSNYFERKKEIEEFNSSHSKVKRGISMIPTKFSTVFPVSFLNQASAFVRIYIDGSVMLSHGGIEMGQGIHTKMVQIAAKVLNIDIEKVHVIETSTETNPNASPTGGSTATELNGHAVIEACEFLVSQLAPIREADPNMPWEKVVVTAYMKRIQLSAFGYNNKSDVSYDPKNNSGIAFRHLTNGVACTMVEVDCTTGEHKVLKTDIVMDVGQSLNPAVDIGQIEGAFVQGYGYGTMEEMIHGLDGQIITNNFSTYKVPTITDIPQEFNVTLLRNSRDHIGAVYSSKGIGEPGINLAVSVVTALRNAVASYRVSANLPAWFEMKVPFTTERIFKACHGISDVDDPRKPWMHI